MAKFVESNVKNFIRQIILTFKRFVEQRHAILFKRKIYMSSRFQPIKNIHRLIALNRSGEEDEENVFFPSDWTPHVSETKYLFSEHGAVFPRNSQYILVFYPR